MATLTARVAGLATAIAHHFRDAVMPRLLPTGGAAGQVLVKTAAADFATAWQSAGGGGGASASITRVEVDFGSTGHHSATFDVSVSGCAAGAAIVASASLDMLPGVAADELEMDPVTVAAHAVAADTVRLIIGAQSRLRGKRAINIMRT